MNKKEKNKFSYLHFMLSILVILIHSINNNTKFELFFSDKMGIGQFAVPTFFIISGFLFFKNTITIDDLKQKLVSRFFTLFIPYLLWNLIYYIFHIIFEIDTTLNIESLIDAVFNYTYNPVFWFIYQLILLTIISPFIYFATNLKLDIPFLILFSMVIILNIDFPFINEDAIIYYTFGCYMARLYKQNKFNIIDKKQIIFTFIISFIILIINRQIIEKVFLNHTLLPYYTLSIIYLRIGISMFIFYISDLFTNYKKLPKFMYNTFFLYAIHYMIVRFIILITNEYLIKYFNKNDFKIIQIFIFMLTAIICVIINYTLSTLMIKKTPKLYNILTGSRKH